MVRTALGALALLVISACGASALTCADQHNACLKRGHKVAECTKSTNSCLQTGRWIGPAGNEYPVSKKQ